MKNDKTQLLELAEFLLFISTISSRVDFWLDKVGDSEERLVNAYLFLADQFMLPNTKSDDSMYLSNRNSQDNYHKSKEQLEKLIKKCDEQEKEKSGFIKNIQDLEKENNSLRDKITVVQRNYSDLEHKYKDALNQVELLKNSNKTNIKFQEELLQESIQITQLKGQLSQKDIEIVDIKRDSDLLVKSLSDEISKLREKIELYEDKISSLKSLTNENEKLKLKIKDLSLLKDKQHEYEELALNLESKSRMIESLMKEKQGYLTQIEKLNKDILSEKEKGRLVEFEKKRLEFDINDLKKENGRMENQLKNKEAQFHNYNNLGELKRNSVNNSEIFNNNEKMNNYLFDLDQSSVLYDIDKTKEERIKLLEKEIEELKQEKNDLIVTYKKQNEEINKALVDKEKLASQLDEINFELKRAINERDKISLEKEKVLLKIQKNELDNQKVEITKEKEKKKAEDELKDALDKLKKATSEKNNLAKEIENLNKEKQNLQSEHQKELDKIKINFEKEANNLKNLKRAQTLNNDTVNEANNLKISIAQKEEIIKNLQTKIKALENENNNFSTQMQDSVEKFNQDILKRSEDLEFYKRSYEEQKTRVNREHELISSSLYELALQFMSLKGELQKKVNLSNNKNWLDAERNKNFPIDK